MKTLTINLTNGSQIEVQYEYVHTLNVYTTPNQEELLAQYYDQVEEDIVQQELAIYYYGGQTSLPADKILQYQPYSGRDLRKILAEQLNKVLDTSIELRKLRVPEGITSQDCRGIVKRVCPKPGRPSHIKG